MKEILGSGVKQEHRVILKDLRLPVIWQRRLDISNAGM